MTKRNSNYHKGQAAQACAAIAALKSTLARALSRGVCPECGGFLHREGAALVCRTPECGGMGAVAFRLNCARVEAGIR
jgi:hypothetical protein